MKTTGRGFLIAMAAPAVLAGCLLLADSIAGAAGLSVIWPRTSLTLPEALILRDAGEATAQLLAGADAEAPARVAVGPRGTPAMLTPLEAAVRSGELDLVELVLNHGATLPAPTAARLACVAERVGEERIGAWLGERLGTTTPCPDADQ